MYNKADNEVAQDEQPVVRRREAGRKWRNKVDTVTVHCSRRQLAVAGRWAANRAMINRREISGNTLLSKTTDIVLGKKEGEV